MYRYTVKEKRSTTNHREFEIEIAFLCYWSTRLELKNHLGNRQGHTESLLNRRIRKNNYPTSITPLCKKWCHKEKHHLLKSFWYEKNFIRSSLTVKLAILTVPNLYGTQFNCAIKSNILCRTHFCWYNKC